MKHCQIDEAGSKKRAHAHYSLAFCKDVFDRETVCEPHFAKGCSGRARR